MGIRHKLAYRRWLRNSFEWQTIRMIALIKARNHCFVCGIENPKNDVHHIYYRDNWNKTQQYDVKVLCGSCHQKVHSLTKPERISGQWPRKRDYSDFWKAAKRIRKEIKRKLNPLVPRKPRPADLGYCTFCESDPHLTKIYLIRNGRIYDCRTCEDCFSHFIEILGADRKVGEFYGYAQSKKKLRSPFRSSDLPTQPPAAGRSDI